MSWEETVANVSADNHELAKNNQALAKRNSMMMMKINKLEKRLSDMLAENVKLKRQNYLVTRDNKQYFEDKLLEIEAKFKSRMEQLSAIFEEVREAEGLPPSFELSKRLQTFDDGESVVSRGREKKRKSIRRKSVYVSNDDDNYTQSTVRSFSHSDVQEVPQEQKQVQVQARKQASQGAGDNSSATQSEASSECVNLKTIKNIQTSESSESSESTGSSSDIEEINVLNGQLETRNTIFTDFEFLNRNLASEPEDEVIDISDRLSQLAERDQSTPEQGEPFSIEVANNEQKVFGKSKKEKGSDQVEKTKSIEKSVSFEESDPDLDEISLVDAVRKYAGAKATRKTRGKSVNYKLPSLRTKMRRSAEFGESMVKKPRNKRPALRALSVNTKRAKKVV